MKKFLAMVALLMAFAAHGQTAPPSPTGPLAGTFALKVVTTGKIDLPIIGEKTPRGHILFLLTRQWNADKAHYTQKAKMCDGTSGSIFGVTTEVSRTGYQRIPPSRSILKVKADKQTISVKNEVFLWGMKNVPNPLSAALPQSMEEAQSAKFKHIVYDVDADGNPGITLKAKGLIDGELHAVQRRVTNFHGKILSPDKQVGRVDVLRESIILQSTTSLVGEGPKTPKQHPNKTLSWFEAIRIDETSTCRDVINLNQAGRFQKQSPL